MTLYEAIQELCRNNKTTIAQLERTLNFGNGTIARWAKASPSLDNVRKVSNHFKVTIDSLLDHSADLEEAIGFSSKETDLILKWRLASKHDRDIIEFILRRYEHYSDSDSEGLFDDIDKRI